MSREMERFAMHLLKFISKFISPARVQQNCRLLTTLTMKLLNENKQETVNSSSNKASKQKCSKSSSLDYKGMTLKQYFRLSEMGEMPMTNEIKEMEDENICSSQQAATPCFQEYNGRHKIKTEVYEDKPFYEQKPALAPKQKNKHFMAFENKTKQLKVQKLPTDIRAKKEVKNPGKTKRATTLASNKDHLNRSTITSFYQIEDKKKRMLDKVKQQKQRINELKLSDAFFITKYADKFKINLQKGY